MSQTAVHATPAPPPPLPRRLADAVIAPGRLFAAVRQGAPWVDALLVVALVAAIAAAGQPHEFYLEQVEGAVDRLGRPVEITSPPDVIVAWNRALAFFAAVVAHPMIAFALAGILALLFRLLRAEGEVEISRYMALSAHAMIVPALGSVLLLPFQWAAGDPALTASASSLLTDPPTGLLGRALASADLFSVWVLVLLGIGGARLHGRRDALVPVTALLGFYFALLLLTASLPVG